MRAQLTTLFNWYVDDYGSDEFRSPIVKTKKTQQWKPNDRERVLADDEIRALWTACGDMGAYGAAVKSALLTAQRFRKVGQMRRADLKERVRLQGRQENGEWMPDSEIGHVWDATRDDDPKNKRVSVVPLSRLAREVIAAVPMIDADKPKDFVFTINGQGPLKGWSQYKAAPRRQDAGAAAAMGGGTRRRRGRGRTQAVAAPRPAADGADDAWRAWAWIPRLASTPSGHALPGVEGIYDRHHYLAEKREAFEKLAELVERIVNPPTDSVVVPFAR